MPHFTTRAEEQADKARTLPEFRSFALPGVKDDVTDILRMIGHSGGVFSTYTKHDISHVEAALSMLDWLIPPATQETMTPVDWLMVGLSVYLHDMGMVVSTAEYEDRKANPEFCAFLSSLGQGQEGIDFLSRVEAMSGEEREVFFFQEFIRKNHARRIREWDIRPALSYLGRGR